MEEKKKVGTINSLLDVTKFSGESTGRMGPAIMFFVAAGVPFLAYVYWILSAVPFKLFLMFYIPYTIRMALITMGEEGRRLDQFKRQLFDAYSSTSEIMDIKTVHEDGMIEYTNGVVAYTQLAHNAGNMDQVQRAQSISSILRKLGNYDYDLRIYNTNLSDELYSRYEGVKLFTGDPNAARDFLKIIDYNREYAEAESLLVVTAITTYSRVNDFISLHDTCEAASKSSEAKVFRGLELATRSEISTLLSEDIDAHIDITEMQRVKYSDGNYYGSKVIEYDYAEEQQVVKTREDDMEGGFMVE